MDYGRLIDGVLAAAFLVAAAALLRAAIGGKVSVRTFRLLGVGVATGWGVFYVSEVIASSHFAAHVIFWHVVYGRFVMALTAATFLVWAFLFNESYWRERAIDELLADLRRAASD